MKVLFLDFDGPLFPYNNTKDHPWPDGLVLHPFINYWKMDTAAVNCLNYLKDLYPFKTVISSSWKQLVTFDSMKHLFKVNNLNMDFHDDPIAQKVTLSKPTRSLDILDWLDDNPVDDYIVLDDPDSGSGLKDNPRLRNVHLVDPYIGLDFNTYHSMLNIVKGWSNV